MSSQNGQEPQRVEGIRLLAQYLKDISFENPKAPQIFQNLAGAKPNFNVGINVQGKKLGDNVYEVAIELKVDSALPEGQVFLIELEYAGLFAIPDLEEAVMEQIMLIECPTILFPFARRIVADMTSDGGFFPLLLEPVDFRALYVNQKRRAAA